MSAPNPCCCFRFSSWYRSRSRCRAMIPPFTLVQVQQLVQEQVKEQGKVMEAALAVVDGHVASLSR